MASRFGTSQLHQRDPRSALFENYNGGGGGGGGGSRGKSASPRPAGGGGYGYAAQNGGMSGGGGGPGSYGYANGNANGSSSGGGGGGLGLGERQSFRPATPNSRGQYSDAILNELESQNDDQVSGILGKVKQLKSMTLAIGDEIRESSAMAEKMNDQFDNARLRIRGTMNRMLIMAEKTGVGWKVWLAFFMAVGFVFFYVWVF